MSMISLRPGPVAFTACATARKENCCDVIGRPTAVGRGVTRCRPPLPITFHPRKSPSAVVAAVSPPSVHCRLYTYVCRRSRNSVPENFAVRNLNVHYADTTVLPSRISFAIFRCGGFKGAA